MKEMLRLEGITFKNLFGEAVRSGTIAIGRGRVVLVGIKETFVLRLLKDLITGASAPKEGTVRIGDGSKARISLVGPERGFIPGQTVEGYLRHIISLSGDDNAGALDGLLTQLEVIELRYCICDRLEAEDLLRVELVMGMIVKPDILILDLTGLQRNKGSQNRTVEIVRAWTSATDTTAVVLLEGPPDSMEEGDLFLGVADNEMVLLERKAFLDLHRYGFRVRLDVRNVRMATMALKDLSGVRLASSDERRVNVDLRDAGAVPYMVRELVMKGVDINEVVPIPSGGEKP